jgi:hypothetical protein
VHHTLKTVEPCGAKTCVQDLEQRSLAFLDQQWKVVEVQEIGQQAEQHYPRTVTCTTARDGMHGKVSRRGARGHASFSSLLVLIDL